MISTKQNNYILGAGIAGLIHGLYHEDYKLISPDIGGQMNSSFNLGPRYLHATKEAESFLSKIDYSVNRTVIKVGYLDDSGWVEPTYGHKCKYFAKSRGNKTQSAPDPTAMNSEMREFNIFAVDFVEIISILKRKIGKDRIISGMTKSIDLEKQILTTDTDCCKDIQFKYDHLVSSISLRDFYSIVSNSIEKPKLDSYHITYVLVHNSYEDIKDFDYVYDARTSTKCHRITKNKGDLVLDWFGYHDAVEAKKELSEFIDCKTLYNSQIIPIEKTPEIENVKFIGRYGTWNRKWKTETVIQEAMNE